MHFDFDEWMSALPLHRETDGNGSIMGDATQLSLLDVPWPISILKCNQRLMEMPAGEQLDVILKDPFIKDNLVLLLNTMDDFEFDIRRVDEGFCLCVTRRAV